MKPPVKFKWRGVHHGYLGLWFAAFGIFFLWMNQGNSLDRLNLGYLVCVVVGVYLVIDDFIEHVFTELTPMRRLWDWMVKR
jgi:hypothetical protein